MADLRFEVISKAVLLHLEVVPSLEIHPEPLARPEEPGKPQGGIRRDAPLPVDDFIDAPRGNADALRQRYWLIPIGPKNSSWRISPGWTGGSFFATACSPSSVLVLFDTDEQARRSALTMG